MRLFLHRETFNFISTTPTKKRRKTWAYFIYLTAENMSGEGEFISAPAANIAGKTGGIAAAAMTAATGIERADDVGMPAIERRPRCGGNMFGLPTLNI